MPAFLVLITLLAASPGCLMNGILLGPNRGSTEHGRAVRSLVPAEEGPIECWVARSPATQPATVATSRTTAMSRPSPATTVSLGEPAAFVVFFPGAGTRSDGLAAMVADGWGGRNVEVWGVNYPGNGGSAGPVVLGRVVPQALAVYDAVRRKAGDRPVFLHAASFGTSVALSVAARRQVAGVVLQNPPPLRQLILGKYGWWNLWILAAPAAMSVPAELDALNNAPAIKAPAVFLLAANDEVVPPCYQQQVAEAYAGPKRLIGLPGSGHEAPVPRSVLPDLNAGLDWLVRRSGTASTSASPRRHEGHEGKKS